MSATDNLRHVETTVDAADGTTLYMQSWSPNDGTKAHLIMCHGYLEHCGRYGEVAEYLAGRHRIAVSVFDFRGHGKSAGTLGYVASFNQYHDDIKAVVTAVSSLSARSSSSAAAEAAATRSDGTPMKIPPLFLLGHSNGGLAVLDLMVADPVFLTNSITGGVIITSPFLAPANELSYGKVILSRVLGYLVPRLSLPANEVTAEILTHDERKRQEHREDEHVQSKFTLGWAVQGMRAQKRVVQELKTCPVPLLLIYAQDDRVACPVVNQKFASTIAVVRDDNDTSNDKTVVERAGEYHEVLNEIKRVETYDLIKEWVLKRC